jgi:hypothetical protein
MPTSMTQRMRAQAGALLTRLSLQTYERGERESQDEAAKNVVFVHHFL